MLTLFALLLFPIIWPVISKFIWPKQIMWQEMGINIGISTFLILIIFLCSSGYQTSDTEILNGSILSKTRTQGQYTESYKCHCYETCSTSSNGTKSCTEHCSTCYREHYTVKWWVDSSFGEITLQYFDETSKRVYNSTDPKNYIDAYVGEPCSTTHSYTNYVKAVPDSLFNSNSESVMKLYEKSIPTYPGIYDDYKIIRVLDVSSHIPRQQLLDFNLQLGNILKTLGPTKQANIITIVTSINDPNYRYAVESAWVGGKKNDVVIFLGVQPDGKINWVDVMTFAKNRGNEVFRVLLRDRLVDVQTFDSQKLTTAINQTILEKFDRLPMSKFEYLKERIVPPTWVMWLLGLISIFGTLGLSLYFKFNDAVEY